MVGNATNFIFCSWTRCSGCRRSNDGWRNCYLLKCDWKCVVNRQRRGPLRGESNADASIAARRRKQKSVARKSKRNSANVGPTNDSIGQWKQWVGLWAQTGQPLKEFWELSPAQTALVFEAKGWMKKRAGAEQLAAFAAQMGLTVNK